MKVFLSWSGNASRRLAEALRDWLPAVLQAVEPWMSAEDIDKGARWSAHVAGELEQARVGILCLTRDNLAAPWILYEAGALSKTLERTAVCPYLWGVRPADLRGPLVQFQAAEANRADTRRLVATINTALGLAALSERSLDRAFKTWWPELEKTLAALPATRPPTRPARSERDLLEETLSLVRELARERSLAPGITGGMAGAAPPPAIQRAFLQGLAEGLQGRLEPEEALVALADRVEADKEQRARRRSPSPVGGKARAARRGRAAIG
jgi:TIR domain